MNIVWLNQNSIVLKVHHFCFYKHTVLSIALRDKICKNINVTEIVKRRRRMIHRVRTTLSFIAVFCKLHPPCWGIIQVKFSYEHHGAMRLLGAKSPRAAIGFGQQLQDAHLSSPVVCLSCDDSCDCLSLSTDVYRSFTFSHAKNAGKTTVLPLLRNGERSGWWWTWMRHKQMSTRVLYVTCKTYIIVIILCEEYLHTKAASKLLQASHVLHMYFPEPKLWSFFKGLRIIFF